MNIKVKLKNLLNSLKYEHTEEFINQQLMLGETLLTTKMQIWDTDKYPFIPQNWDDYGFKVFSQNNEDGLLQYIMHHTCIPQKTFIEFGVEDYSECNTRFLLMHNNWSGFIMDGSSEWMQALRKHSLYWKRTINSKGVFITKDNINQLISNSGFHGEIGLLSIDIDGNDYWVLHAIDSVNPQILICEYNPIFGSKETVSIPYSKDFFRTNAHYSNLYYGASLAAFCELLSKREYKLVCVNNIGNNAFFVKRNASDLPEISISDAWINPLFRESRDKSGNLTFLSMEEGRKLILDMPVIDTVSGKNKNISELSI